MSLKEEFGENYKNLNGMIEPYLADLVNMEPYLKVSGKTLEEANREQPQWFSYFDERRVELHTWLKFFEAEIARVRSKLLKGMENYALDLSDRMKEKYIDGEEAYLAVYEKYLAIKEVHDQYASAVESFRMRGFALNNITKIRVASLEDVIL